MFSKTLRMKNLILFFCVAFFLLPSCGSVAPLSSMEESVKIHVECQDNPSVRHMVVSMLKQAKARDVIEQAEIHYMVIEAAYYKADNSMDRLQEIVDLLTTSSGVVRAEILENHNVVKQNR